MLFDHSCLVHCVCLQLFAVTNITSTFCAKKLEFWPVTQGKGVRLPRVLQTWACFSGSGLGSISRGSAEEDSHTQLY